MRCYHWLMVMVGVWCMVMLYNISHRHSLFCWNKKSVALGLTVLIISKTNTNIENESKNDWKFFLVCDKADPWDCCTTSNPCGENEGDCDNDNECLGHLKCGDKTEFDDNCDSTFTSGADCCFDPNKIGKC